MPLSLRPVLRIASYGKQHGCRIAAGMGSIGRAGTIQQRIATSKCSMHGLQTNCRSRGGVSDARNVTTPGFDSASTVLGG
eukprot:105756-Amphidinium_carterae.1